MKIILTGGGTLGHVIPTLTVARTLENKFSEGEIKFIYLGGKNSAEEKYLKEYETQDIQFIPIYSGKFRRYFDIKNFIDPIFVILGIIQSLWIIIKHRPKAVFSKGGSVSVPACYAAWLLRIPVIAHESDLTIGLANRLTEKVAKVVCTSFPKQNENPKYVHTGLPIVFQEGDRQRFLSKTKFTDEKPIMLVMGGSSGAKFINDLIWKYLNQLTQHIQIIHVYVQGTLPFGSDIKEYYPIKSFTQEELGDLLASSTFILARSGATSLFEAITAGIPFLGIPLPLSQSRGDQIENARFFEKAGALKYMEEDKMSHEEMVKKIIAFSKDTKLHTDLKTNMSKFSSKDAAKKIAEIIKRYL